MRQGPRIKRHRAVPKRLLREPCPEPRDGGPRDLIDGADGLTLAVGKHDTHASRAQAAYTLLKQFDASRAECGTDEILNGVVPLSPEGISPKAKPAAMLENFLVSTAFASEPLTIERRMKDCAALPGSSKTTRAGVSWNLVARKRDRSTGKFSEVWKDLKGLVWGDRLDSNYTHHNAVALGLNDKVTEEKACISDEGKRAFAGVSGKSFGLPKIEEFEQAEKDGIREVLPNMRGSWFWSASLSTTFTIHARVFSGLDGVRYTYLRDDHVSVRCVGR